MGSRKRTPSTALSAVILVGALIAMVFFMMSSRGEKKVRIEDCTAETTGVVTDVIRSGTKHPGYYYFSVVKPDNSELFGGRELRSESSQHQYHEGDIVKIFYDPDDTSAFYIEHSSPPGSSMKLALSFGAVALIFGFRLIKSVKAKGGI